MDHNILKKSLRIAAVLSFFLFCAFAFSGCGHYSRREAAEWFQKNVVDEGSLEDYITAQKYPCQVTYALAYREPLTFDAAEEPFTMRYTCVSEDGDRSVYRRPA